MYNIINRFHVGIKEKKLHKRIKVDGKNGERFFLCQLIIIRFLIAEKPVLFVTTSSLSRIELVELIILQVLCIWIGFNRMTVFYICMYVCECEWWGSFSIFRYLEATFLLSFFFTFLYNQNVEKKDQSPCMQSIVSITFTFFAKKLTCDLDTMLHIDGHVS